MADALTQPRVEAAVLRKAALRGISLCRRGDWIEGMDVLGWVAERDHPSAKLPALFYSYLGFGLARCHGRPKEGLPLCEHAAEVDFCRGETYYNLARVYLLMNRRASAIRTILRGLRADRRNPYLNKLRRQLGRRRRAVVPFLQRSNPVNITLGRVRHFLLQRDGL